MEPIEGLAICLNGHVVAVRRGTMLSGPFNRVTCPTCDGILYSALDPRLHWPWVRESIIRDIEGYPPISGREYFLKDPW